MTARELQDALVADLRTLFAGRRYKTPGDQMSAVSVFAQNVPKRVSEDDEDPFPFIVVRIVEGGIDSQTDPHKVSVYILVGVYDDNAENQGHRTVLEMIELIQMHYEGTPLLDGKFVFTDPFHWALQDEDSYPYFYGGVEITFNAPAPRREWSDLV